MKHVDSRRMLAPSMRSSDSDFASRCGPLVVAEIEALADRPEEAAAILRWAFDELQDMGWTSVMSTMAAFLADALVA